MPTIFDNIETWLLPALKARLDQATRADFCVGYFNLRGWRPIAPSIEGWVGDDAHRVRLLVGMQRAPQDDIRELFGFADSALPVDGATVVRLKKKMAEEFRTQLTVGAPSNADEAALRQLSAQLHAGKVVVKLYLRHPLHAKLYLLHRPDDVAPIVGYLGSSNLTFSGLSKQGELNVDVIEQDACQKLQAWFDVRWNDSRCLDISAELAAIIDESWAREELLSPYLVYLKMAYHLSDEARAGLNEFRIPKDFGNRLFEFQKAAVKIAAHHLNKRNGVMIGDVVGLGKTLMATALARIFEDDQGTETLIICPKNLVSMWEDYAHRYRLRGKVLSVTRTEQELKELRRYRVVLIDESHNLRNPEGVRYRAIREYIRGNESKVILLSATPYNKTYVDLSAQLGLFVDGDEDLGIRPEHQLKAMGETEFIRKHQCGVRTLKAFEKSEYADDWRELMRRFLVRRTRTFIQQNYAQTAEDGRTYLLLENGDRSYFPVRVPKTLTFPIDEAGGDPYARLYAPSVVSAISELTLPRYGLGNYVATSAINDATKAEAQTLDGLSRAGKRLMGFSRTNLFKRLESGGPAFLQSVERHILRNYVFLHALETGQPVPLGSQDAELLDIRFTDQDAEGLLPPLDDGDDEQPQAADKRFRTAAEYQVEAAAVYAEYRRASSKRFKWLRPILFDAVLATDLTHDAEKLLGVLDACAVSPMGRTTRREGRLNCSFAVRSLEPFVGPNGCAHSKTRSQRNLHPSETPKKPCSRESLF